MLIVKRSLRTRPSRRRLLAWLFVAIYSTLLVVVGAVIQREGFVGTVVKPWLSTNTRTFANYVSGLRSNPKRLVLDVKFKHLEKLRAQRERALAEGLMFASSDDFVPATLTQGDDSARVRIRLKGDAIDHLINDKWSFRVSARGDDTILGLKSFSLHHPKTRNYIFEWLYHRALRREGVIALRYDFVMVTLNGKDLGVYALEEHFDKRLVENSQRREGPIVRFDEDAMWREIAAQVRPSPGAKRGQSGSYLSSRIDAFQSSQLVASPESAEAYARIVERFEGFRRGTHATHEVFDVELLAKYFAITDLMGAEHGSRWHNIRFYCNPVTKLLEPVGFDGNGGLPITRLAGADWQDLRQRDPAHRNDSFRGRLFADPLMRQCYAKHLERVSKGEYLTELLATESGDMDAALAVIYREWPDAPFGDFEVLRANQRYIRSMLEPPQVLNVGLRSAQNGVVTLEVGNLQNLSVVVVGMVLPGVSERLTPRGPTVIEGKRLGRIVDYQLVGFRLPPSVEWSHAMALQAKLIYRIDGTESERLVELTPFAVSGSSDRAPIALQRSPNIHRFDFVEVDRAALRITIKAGRWPIRQHVIAPAGYTFVIEPGTTIDMTSGAMLLSYSPLDWRGTAEHPITIISSDGAGQGVAVIGAEEVSQLAHVRFENLSYPHEHGWVLPGSVTFYESPVDAERCSFVANRSEDGLNLFRSKFTLRHSLFERSASDALDADFCRGTIEDVRFLNIGNDGIDVSGSDIDIRRVTVDGSGDKAISSGEASVVRAEALDIRNARIGLASKDLSELHVDGATLRDCIYAVAAFEKKSEFGPAKLRATDLEVLEIKQPHLVQTGSDVVLNGDRIEVRDLDIQKILYAVEKQTKF